MTSVSESSEEAEGYLSPGQASKILRRLFASHFFLEAERTFLTGLERTRSTSSTRAARWPMVLAGSVGRGAHDARHGHS
jgi:hypothetical protein